ncbi:2-aminoethylphosphonate--pyruvate transaminase [Bacilliculturomica massiliensis]|uniref:2-aminoethylphosphonate--pyruvate transaminase n=1 Tax=Bacilliculturomica massiliensis TaxID=1917867 RepID=UPI001A910138|nr:2-aminoethylphosphonate--pyruvate transaminase [Bacilliculturomica massiliensis]
MKHVMMDNDIYNPKIKAVIFDWAGTTIDYGCFAPLAGFVDGFSSKGVHITSAEARKPMGMLKLDHTRAIAEMPRVREAFAQINGREPEEKDVLEIYHVFEKTLMDNILSYTDVKPGVCEAVERLRERGIRVGSTTGYTRAMMDRIIGKVAAAGYRPDTCVCADEVPAGRPYPYMIWANMTQLGVPDPQLVVKVGDTVSDIGEGVSAGVWTVGVVMGSSELGLTMEEAGALSAEELDGEISRVKKTFYKAGADYIIADMSGLEGVIADIERRLAQSAPRKLLTPGPLTTRRSVKEAMLADHCTWDEEYKAITRGIMDRIAGISANTEEYAAVLLQGSGSYAVEAMIQSFCRDGEKLLIVENGEYGKRMARQAGMAGKTFEILEFDMCHAIDPAAVEQRLDDDPEIRTVMFVHSETTSGVINPVEKLARLAKSRGKTVLVDAMSSFGAYEIDMKAWGIDGLASSANKCLEGLPGLAFVIARRELIENAKGNSRSHCLDLYDQYQGLYPGGGKFRFTSPTNVVLALEQALREYDAEGGQEARKARYMENHRALVRGMEALGIRSIVPRGWQSCIITTFDLKVRDPKTGAEMPLDFDSMYQWLKARGFVIYPGKLTDQPTFRIGTIGDIYSRDIRELCRALGEYIREHQSLK